MDKITGVVQHLNKERAKLEDQLQRITAAITAFGRVYMNGTKSKAIAATEKRTMSAASRRKLSLAMKARWAKRKANVQAPKPTRTISAAGRKRIAAAQRARWAKMKSAA